MSLLSQSRSLALVAAGAILATAAVPTLAADPPKDPQTFNIGAILAMTGPGSYYGQVMGHGAELAVDEINAKGGIDGIKLQLFIDDHKSGSAKEGVAAMERLINLHHVGAVENSYGAPTFSTAPIADAHKIFMINGGGAQKQLVQASKYLILNRTLIDDLAVAAVRYAQSRGFKKMAQVAWQNDLGDALRQRSEELWKESGGSVVASESIVPGAPNIDTQMAKVRSSRPDFVANWSFTPTGGLVVKRVREFGMKVPIIGVEWTKEDGSVAGKYGTDFEYVSDYFAPSKDNAWSEQFAADYQKRYGAAPEFFAANYYEGIYIIAELIRRARAEGGDYWNGESLMKAFRKDLKFKTIYPGGTISFTPEGAVHKPVALFKVDDQGNGQFVKYVTSQ